MVTGAADDPTIATAPPTFTFAPAPLLIDTGYYQLQIRPASDYGEGTVVLQLTRSFDINDRLSDSITWEVPPSWDISQGMTFVVNDGVHSVTFQFLGQGVTSAADPNDQPIYFAGS